MCIDKEFCATIKKIGVLGMVAHSFNPSPWETDRQIFVRGQPDLYT